MEGFWKGKREFFRLFFGGKGLIYNFQLVVKSVIVGRFSQDREKNHDVEIRSAKQHPHVSEFEKEGVGKFLWPRAVPIRKLSTNKPKCFCVAVFWFEI